MGGEEERYAMVIVLVFRGEKSWDVKMKCA